MPPGRYALWHLLRKYAVNKATAAQADMVKLIRHEAKGDLALYLDGLDSILQDQDDVPSEAFLYSLVEPQLRTFKSMEHVFYLHDHAKSETLEKECTVIVRQCKDLRDARSGVEATERPSRVSGQEGDRGSRSKG